MKITREQQKEWASLKYLVMSRSQHDYNQIRLLFKDNEWSPEKEVLYRQALVTSSQIMPTRGSLINAYQHIWGYFKQKASSAEKATYTKLIEELTVEDQEIKEFFKELALKYQIEYLIQSKLLFPD